MKTFRAFLLILLVVLVPLRGAFAVERLCSVTSGPKDISQLTGHVSHEAGVMSGSHQHHGATTADHAHHDHLGTASQCHVCSALGGMAGPIASLDVPTLLSGTVVFSRLQVPPARLIPERLERPPRAA